MTFRTFTLEAAEARRPMQSTLELIPGDHEHIPYIWIGDQGGGLYATLTGRPALRRLRDAIDRALARPRGRGKVRRRSP